jgi:hypothetical protein
MWPELRDHPFTDDHAVGLVGAASAARAAGHEHAATALMKQARERDAERPSYYGAAWIALAETWLDL